VLDLDADWDPTAHDAQMANMYGADADNDADDFDAEKPTWDDDIDITDIVPDADVAGKKKKKDKKKKKKGGDDAKDEGVDLDAMDADLAPDDEEWDGTEEMRKRVVARYLDEIAGLEFNDMVCGLFFWPYFSC
jgi:protein KRI1